MLNKELIDRYAKLDTPSVSDALDSLGISGGIMGVSPVVSGKKMVGCAFTVKYQPLSGVVSIKDSRSRKFRNAGNYIDEVSTGSVIVVDNQGRRDCTSWGDILTSVAVQKKVAGTVVWGSVRDVERIREFDYPVFSCGVFMQSGKNRAIKVAHQVDICVGGVVVHPGDLVFGDDSGCLVVPANVADEVCDRAEQVKENERLIMMAVKNGMRLVDARKRYNYSKPWEKSGE